MTAVVLNLQNVGLTDEQFYQLCMVNDRWRFEQTAAGELIVMPPVGGRSGNREADSIGQLWLWNREAQLGKVFSSSTIFRLPNGGKRSPDAAWVRQDRWDALSPEDQEKFPPLCPDFVMELRSRTDDWLQLQAKMQEYLDAGLQLGWLIDPQIQRVEIYRPSQPVEARSLPATLSGETVLPGFSMTLKF
ncbi:MAG: Uma2 family endonuclease [Coleofasciculaceae cyanobacterium SM2_3_26]|nr:Uma2 family endonuclease [Coleofasciculaceae cyanobacterium SM2_3_26]